MRGKFANSEIFADKICRRQILFEGTVGSFCLRDRARAAAEKFGGGAKVPDRSFFKNYRFGRPAIYFFKKPNGRRGSGAFAAVDPTGSTAARARRTPDRPHYILKNFILNFSPPFDGKPIKPDYRKKDGFLFLKSQVKKCRSAQKTAKRSLTSDLKRDQLAAGRRCNKQPIIHVFGESGF